MWVSSLLLVIVFKSLLPSFCHGNQLRLEFQSQVFPSTTTSSAIRPTTGTILDSLRHIPRGGSTKIATYEPQLENNRKLPSLFQSESDVIYDQYASCLAATEGLRRIRDETLRQQQEECTNDSFSNKRNIREARKWANAFYAENASKIIEAMGMPIAQFNAIGNIVCKDTILKQKVLEQAYLYRLQSNVAMDETPVVNEQISKPFRLISKTKFHMFCQSMYEVEKLRRTRVEQLKQTFQLNELPSITSQATLRPLLDSNVRSAIDSFPIMASEVVHQFGLNNDEFNELLRRTKASTFFRWKVLRNIGMIERQQMK